MLFLISDCPSYLSKPKKTDKRKLPTERKFITRKRRKKNTDVEFETFLKTGKGVDVEDKFPSQDPWALFHPKHCKVPPSWYWIDSNDEPSVCMKFNWILNCICHDYYCYSVGCTLCAVSVDCR